jgi:predicted phosphodiesterase
MKLFLKFLFLFFCSLSFAQTNLPYSVYLVGDAGEDTVPGKALLLLKEQLLLNPNSAVVFMGDNVYPSGLKLKSKNSIAHLESQLQILNEYKGQVYFVPGNHDWDAQGPKGLKILKDEETYVGNYLQKNSICLNKDSHAFLPVNGLPGPESVMLNDKLRLIIIDTQWFLHAYKKNHIGTVKHTKQLFYARLDSLLSFSKNNNEQVIITGHHPMYTNGAHSKSRQPLRFLINYTPFQIFGLMGLNRLLSQDIAQPKYKRMRSKILASIKKYDNVIYASGHDHNLQYFKKGTNSYIVSGSGSKLSSLQKRKKNDSVFQDDKKTGFFEIQYSVDGKSTTLVYRVGEEKKVLDEK